MTKMMDRLTKRMNTTCAERRDGGFTLIELLVVIVILGILAGIAIFAVGQFESDAKTACTEANKRITDTTAAAYKINPGGTYANAGDCS